MGKGRRVFVVGVGMTPFTKPKSDPAEGPHWNLLGKWAVERALEDACVDRKDVEYAACGTMFNIGAAQRILYDVGIFGVPMNNGARAPRGARSGAGPISQGPARARN